MRLLLIALVALATIPPVHAVPGFEAELQEHQRKLKAREPVEGGGVMQEFKTIAVFAASDERAEAIEKLIRDKYCKNAFCKTVILQNVGFHPGDRDLFAQLQRAYQTKVALVGLDFDVHVGMGGRAKLEHLRRQGAVIQAVGFAGEDAQHPIEVCDADLGGPGCGGD